MILKVTNALLLENLIITKNNIVQPILRSTKIKITFLSTFCFLQYLNPMCGC